MNDVRVTVCNHSRCPIDGQSDWKRPTEIARLQIPWGVDEGADRSGAQVNFTDSARFRDQGHFSVQGRSNETRTREPCYRNVSVLIAMYTWYSAQRVHGSGVNVDGTNHLVTTVCNQGC